MHQPKNTATINYFFTSFLTLKHLDYHLKGTTSERPAEMYGEDNDPQLCIVDCIKRYRIPI